MLMDATTVIQQVRNMRTYLVVSLLYLFISIFIALSQKDSKSKSHNIVAPLSQSLAKLEKFWGITHV